MLKAIRMNVLIVCLSIICGVCYGGADKVLIIGIDGCRPDALLAAKTPNIDKLWKQGAYSFDAKTASRSSSGPCWTSMLTGVWPEKHGILNNKYSVPSKYPHFFQRIKTLKPELKTVSIVYWSPLHKILPDESVDVKKSARPDAKVAELVANTLAGGDPDVVFVQFDEVDHAGHKYGYRPDAAGYVKSIETADSFVGRIIGSLEARKSYKKENWLIILTTDHGGIEKRHGGNTPQETTIFFIAHGKTVVKGELKEQVGVVDVAVTSMAHLGLPIDPKWRLDGKVQGIRNTRGKRQAR